MSLKPIGPDALDRRADAGPSVGEQVNMPGEQRSLLTGEQSYAFSSEQQQEIEPDLPVSKSLLTGEQIPVSQIPSVGEQSVLLKGEHRPPRVVVAQVSKRLLTGEQMAKKARKSQVSKPLLTRKKAGEQTSAHQKKQAVSKPVLTEEILADVIPFDRSRNTKQQPVKPRKHKSLVSLLTGEQKVSEQDAKDVQGLLKKPVSGWWEVKPEGRGFYIKFRWRNPKQQTITFPRISSEQYQILKESGYERARKIVEDRILGHLEDCLRDPAKRDKARLAAERIGVRIGNNQMAFAANY